MQGYALDNAIPLVNMLEAARARPLTLKDAAESAQQALKLIANTSAHLPAEGWRKAFACLNKEPSTLVFQEGTFVDAILF